MPGQALYKTARAYLHFSPTSPCCLQILFPGPKFPRGSQKLALEMANRHQSSILPRGGAQSTSVSLASFFMRMGAQHAACRGDGSNSPAHGKSLCGNFSVQYSIVLYRHGRHANFACSNGRSPDTVQRRDASALPRSVYCLSPFIVWPNPQVRQPSGTRLCPRLGIGPGRHCRLGCTATVYI